MTSPPFAAAERGGLRGLVPPREVTGRAVETVLTALVKLEGIGLAMEAFQSFRKEKRYPKVSSQCYSFLMRECARIIERDLQLSQSLSNADEIAARTAVAVYDAMIQDGCKPTQDDVACILALLVSTQNEDELRRIVRDLKSYFNTKYGREIEPNSFLYEVVIAGALRSIGIHDTSMHNVAEDKNHDALLEFDRAGKASLLPFVRMLSSIIENHWHISPNKRTAQMIAKCSL